MLRATPMHELEHEIKYHHLFVWSVSFICCIAPWIGNAYGYTANIELQYGFANFECMCCPCKYLHRRIMSHIVWICAMIIRLDWREIISIMSLSTVYDIRILRINLGYIYDHKKQPDQANFDGMYNNITM